MNDNVHIFKKKFRCKNDLFKLIDVMWKELVFGGHLFAAGAVSLIMACSIVFMIPVSPDILFISYLLFYVIYLHDYTQGAESDELTNVSRTEYLQCRNKSNLTLTVSSVILLLLLINFTNELTFILCLCTLVMGLLYGKYFKKVTKRIPAFKNIFVSFVWSFMVLFVFIYYSLPVTCGAIMLALFVFIRMMNIQILFDVRDMEGDLASGLLTVPALLGEKRYPYILRIINIFSIIFVLACVLQDLLPVFIMGMTPLLYYASRYIDKVVTARGNYISYVSAAFEPVMWLVLISAGRSLSIIGIL